MDKTMDYIFGQLKNNELAVKMLRKALRRQLKLNNKFAFALASVGAYILMNENRYNKLRKEIEELKLTKGE